jgi:hypothetical protein
VIQIGSRSRHLWEYGRHGTTLAGRRAGDPESARATASWDAIALIAINGKEHLVSQFVISDQLRDDGWYPALCGTWVAGASMCEPPGRPCDLCTCLSQVMHAETGEAVGRAGVRNLLGRRGAVSNSRSGEVGCNKWGNWSGHWIAGSQGRPSASMTRVSKKFMPCFAAVDR